MIALLEWALLLFIGFFAGMIHTYGVVAYFPKAKSTGAIVCSRHSFRSMHKKQSPIKYVSLHRLSPAFLVY
ncbi:hypothetical protein M4D48_00405 [Alkalihalobacillus clausii]|jgi:hypothetical protein|uniref:hypothetical protein n=1 Tax=Shouchella clausii TaxID=79880 RepID=UPI000BA60346|nr:hypothetical protein [Shouchella clausii]MCM3547043.1 hypothetical protein [Shouchella clausii]PAF15618.1 hypothetical protein CHH59_03160 [Shouchella clausii]